MKNKKDDSEVLSVVNVEKVIDKAIEMYYKQGRIVDVLFWSRAIALLKEKYKKGEKNEN